MLQSLKPLNRPFSANHRLWESPPERWIWPLDSFKAAAQPKSGNACNARIAAPCSAGCRCPWGCQVSEYQRCPLCDRPLTSLWGLLYSSADWLNWNMATTMGHNGSGMGSALGFAGSQANGMGTPSSPSLPKNVTDPEAVANKGESFSFLVPSQLGPCFCPVFHAIIFQTGRMPNAVPGCVAFQSVSDQIPQRKQIMPCQDDAASSLGWEHHPVDGSSCHKCKTKFCSFFSAQAEFEHPLVELFTSGSWTSSVPVLCARLV